MAAPQWEVQQQCSSGSGTSNKQSTKNIDCNSEGNNNDDSDDNDNGNKDNGGLLLLPYAAAAANAVLLPSCHILTQQAGRSYQDGRCLSRCRREHRGRVKLPPHLPSWPQPPSWLPPMRYRHVSAASGLRFNCPSCHFYHRLFCCQCRHCL